LVVCYRLAPQAIACSERGPDSSRGSSGTVRPGKEKGRGIIEGRHLHGHQQRVRHDDELSPIMARYPRDLIPPYRNDQALLSENLKMNNQQRLLCYIQKKPGLVNGLNLT